MAYVPVPKDLSKVKTKVAFNLTKRQIVCFAVALLLGLPLFFLLKDSTGTSLASMATLVLNAVGPSGPLVLLTEPPVEYGVLLIFLTCHSYLLFVGAGRYGNTKYTAPALASLPEFYCS